MQAFTLKIVTPEREVFNGQVVSVIAPGAAGSFGVLAGHAAMVSQLQGGPLEIERPDGICLEIEIGEGYAKIQDNEMIVLATSAEMEAKHVDT